MNIDVATRNIESAVSAKGVSVSKMLSEIDLGKNTISKLTSGKSVYTDTICKIADYLNVSVDYLLGRSDKPDPEKEFKDALNIIEECHLDDEMLDFIKTLAIAPSDIQKIIIASGEAILNREGKNG